MLEVKSDLFIFSKNNYCTYLIEQKIKKICNTN